MSFATIRPGWEVRRSILLHLPLGLMSLTQPKLASATLLQRTREVGEVAVGGGLCMDLGPTQTLASNRLAARAAHGRHPEVVVVTEVSAAKKVEQRGGEQVLFVFSMSCILTMTLRI
jgi:hypothetical protein